LSSPLASSPATHLCRRPASSHGWHPVVDLAPSLLDYADEGLTAERTRKLDARVVHAARGGLDLSALAEDAAGWIGLLILDGVVIVRLDAGRAHTAWLVGADDLVRPWDMDDSSLTRPAAWRALTPTRIALLDHEFSMRAGGVPILARALVARTARTTAWLLAKSLVMASPLVEDRLLLAFALLAERWGTVNHDGVRLRLPLTHAVLALICGVRRPSVTIALHALETEGVLTRTDEDAWLLHRHRIDRLRAAPSCWPQYADALGMSAYATSG
jgi:CRP/FNR family transcriptional regulator, cyclic AMP receptor protein